MLNKPAGCISARSDHRKRQLIYDHVPKHYPQLPHVGRLDYNTEGLLLFTDDGKLAQALLNRQYRTECNQGKYIAVEKHYWVKIRDILDSDHPGLLKMKEPLHYSNGYITNPARVRVVAYRKRATWVEVVIDEGRYRQVRQLCKRSGFQIVKLRRVKLGPLELGELKLRWCRPLTSDEVSQCYAQALPLLPLPDFNTIEDPLYA